MLEAQDISFAWGKAPLLDGVTFSVGKGSSVELPPQSVVRLHASAPLRVVIVGVSR